MLTPYISVVILRRMRTRLALASASLLALLFTLGCSGSHNMNATLTSPTPSSTLPPTDATADGFSANVYRNVVRSKVIRAFERLSERDAHAALDLMDEDVHYWFSGSHALGGERVTKRGVAKWFDRLFRMFRSTFVLRSVEVAGWPWRSTVVTVFEDHVEAAVGTPYVNHCVQVTKLRWGKAVEIRTYVDTARIEAMLSMLAESGVDEARAPPIVE
jgi:ketosteroid isomerase-like protein